MKRWLTGLLALGVALGAFPSAPWAGQNYSAKILIHLTGATTKGACGTRAMPACGNMTTQGALYPAAYFAYLVVAQGNATAGIGGLQCGISYPGGVGQPPIDVFGWTLCASLEFSSTGWPASGGGNLITWDTATKCQRTEPGGPGSGVVAAAGYFYLAAYAEGTLAVTTRPVDGRAKVADCASNEDIVAVHDNDLALGSVRFSAGGLQAGYNPCGSETGPRCHIIGPTSVGAGEAGLVYSVDPSEVSPGGSWTISGNGVIDINTNASATVHATGSGTFSVGYQLDASCTDGCRCGLTVTVHAPTAVEASSWSHIKAMYPGSR